MASTDKRLRERWEAKNARNIVKRHDPYFAAMFGGVDNGCLKEKVTAGIKRKRRKKK